MYVIIDAQALLQLNLEVLPDDVDYSPRPVRETIVY